MPLFRLVPLITTFRCNHNVVWFPARRPAAPSGFKFVFCNSPPVFGFRICIKNKNLTQALNLYHIAYIKSTILATYENVNIMKRSQYSTKKMSTEKLKNIVMSMNASREKKGGWGYKIDSKNGEIRIHTTICSVLLGANKKEIDKIIKAKNENVPSSRHKIRKAIIQELIEKGRSENCLDMWAEEGISISDIGFLLDFCKGNNHGIGLEFKQLYQAISETELFSNVLRDLIPSEVFALLNKSQQQIIRPTAQSLVKPKRPHLTRLKHYRPAYDAIDKTQKELTIVRHLKKLWGGEREAPTPSGNIDLLTADKLIEVKSGENWKHGIGQLIAYGFHKPDRQMVLYLFDYEAIDLANVRPVCGKVGIELMLHE